MQNKIYIYFFSSRVLNITSSIEDLGGFQWELVGTLLLGWIIVYLIVWKGLHSSGKVNATGYILGGVKQF